VSGKVLLDRVGGVAWIRIHNPTKHNAISLAMWRELEQIASLIDDDIRCIVVRGEGERAFVSGADISEFGSTRRTPQDIAAYDCAADAAMSRLEGLAQPTVAMISGYCVGAGMALALCCDIRLASDSAQFAIPAARLGLGYGVVHTQRLLDVAGAAAAIDMLASANRYSAGEALTMRLVNRVTCSENFVKDVEAYVGRIAANAPLTIRAAKRTIRDLRRATLHTDLSVCKQMLADCFLSEDYAEGICAFTEKREPVFWGK
jgi:enoyl-CoA hydratase